ncbi:MAG TPA: cell wall-binding protein, partial [Firmicutes bacterium]|nr:cell wall-binding protein [Bacillota bacterium]
MKKRIISMLLVVCMLVSALPMQVFAVNDSAAPVDAAESVAKNPFTDIKSGDWFYDAVQYARVNGFFSGTSATTFDPKGTMTRGMFVTVLGRMAVIDPANYTDEAGFTDVAEDAWYAPYVAWAAKYGITGGVGNGKFDPNANITREQMAVFYVRYFEAFDVNYDTGADITTVPADLGNVSDWAKDAVLKLWKTGLLNGDGKNFNPTSNATRAEAAALSQRTDAAVETWYTEPGVPSERVSVGLDGKPVDGEAEEKKPGSVDISGGDSSEGDTTTTYYEVQFAMVDGQSGDGVTLPKTKTYASGTKISAIPTPYQQNGIFMGWYYDAAMAKAVGSFDTLTRNMTLYAKIGEITAVSEQETPNYVTVNVAAEDVDAYSFGIFGYTDGCVMSFRQITSANADVEFSMNGTTVKVKDGYTSGQTYRVELDEDVAAQFIVNGVTQDKSIRVLNIITEKGEVQNLKLDGDMKYIPAAKVSDMIGTALDGLFSVSVGTQGTSGVTQNKNVGTFTYTGSDIAIGNTVAIYSGMRPDLRNKNTLGSSEDGAVIYVEITAKNGTSYSYKTAESEDVLFTPDVLPVSTAADTDGDSGNQSITV